MRMQNIWDTSKAYFRGIARKNAAIRRKNNKEKWKI